MKTAPNWMRTACLLTLALALSPLARAANGPRCSEDLASDKGARAASTAAGNGAAVDTGVPLDPLTQLQQIAHLAAQRSAAVGAARLLADAAAYDEAEAKGGKWPEVTLAGSLYGTSSQVSGQSRTNQHSASLGMNVSAPLYDGGRLDELIRYRKELTGAARYNAAVTKETVVLEAVSAALERSRYKLQANVYHQYMRKMGCLVEALEGIVAEDKGRMSELVQARKSLEQTELQRDQALAQSRQSEIRLRKFIGDDKAVGDGFTLPLSDVPDVAEIRRQIELSNDARLLRANANAADTYAKSVVAGQRPQLNWTIGQSSSHVGSNTVSSLQAGVTLTYTIFNGYSDQAAAQAASKRAEAARESLAELVNNKYAQTAQVHDIATSAFDRARRYVDVLRDSERVRMFTFQQWSQLGRRSLFDVMSAESDHFNLRIAYVNALYDGYEATAQMRSLGSGLMAWLLPSEIGQP
jgi:adhesin transport system outer membrane protein